MHHPYFERIRIKKYQSVAVILLEEVCAQDVAGLYAGVCAMNSFWVGYAKLMCSCSKVS